MAAMAGRRVISGRTMRQEGPKVKSWGNLRASHAVSTLSGRDAYG